MYYRYVKNPDEVFSKVVINLFGKNDLSGEEQSIYQINYLIDWAKINKNTVFVDLGSHEGQEINELAKTGCMVHAFEPNPHTFKTLSKRFKNYNNYFLNNVAASTKYTKEYFYFLKTRKYIEKDSGSLLKTDNFVHSKNFFKKLILTFYYKFFFYKIKIQSIDIVKYIDNLNSKIDILKIDTEGTEYEILDHLFNTGAYKKIDKIFYEDHIRKIVHYMEPKNMNRNQLSWLKLRSSCLKKYYDANYNLYEF